MTFDDQSVIFLTAAAGLFVLYTLASMFHRLADIESCVRATGRRLDEIDENQRRHNEELNEDLYDLLTKLNTSLESFSDQVVKVLPIDFIKTYENMVAKSLETNNLVIILFNYFNALETTRQQQLQMQAQQAQQAQQMQAQPQTQQTQQPQTQQTQQMQSCLLYTSRCV